MIAEHLKRLAAGQNLSLEEATAAFDLVMSGRSSEQEISALLLGLREKGETVDEVAGAARSLRKHMTPVRTRRTGLVDTCGTGGDGSGTFNISTAAAIVTAAAGVPVAKHGNRSISSRSGSADVLAELGVNVEASVACVEQCLDEIGICFCFAPHLHPAMKHVGSVRKKLGVPTVFNLLGPLCNPAQAPYQVLGVGKPHLHRLMAEALARVGVERAVVVCGGDGLDEVTLSGPTTVLKIENGEVHEFQWTPANFGLEPAGRETMLIDGPEASAAMIRRVLDGEKGPPRDIVILNAAAAIFIAGAAPTPRAAAEKVAEAIDNGAAKNLLTRFAELSHRT